MKTVSLIIKIVSAYDVTLQNRQSYIQNYN